MCKTFFASIFLPASKREKGCGSRYTVASRDELLEGYAGLWEAGQALRAGKLAGLEARPGTPRGPALFGQH